MKIRGQEIDFEVEHYEHDGFAVMWARFEVGGNHHRLPIARFSVRWKNIETPEADAEIDGEGMDQLCEALGFVRAGAADG